MADDTMRVLLASDDSIAARAAEAWIACARWARPPIVRVMSVAAPTVTDTAWLNRFRHESLRRAIDDLDRAEQLRALDIADQVAGRLRASGIEAEGHAVHGEAAHEILREIQASTPDLVAVGPRGRSDFSVALLGSVTQQLLTHSTSPLLVARSGGVPAGELPQTIVLMVSGTLAVSGAIDWLRRVGWLSGTRVVIAGLLGTSPGLEPERSDIADAIGAEVRLAALDVLHYLEGLVKPHAEEVLLELHMGQPLQAAMAVGDSHQADLLVVGKYPPQPGDQPFADKLARYASASVLVIPVSEAPSGVEASA
jgi:nucleotide-binding universal stress UspA family protein